MFAMSHINWWHRLQGVYSFFHNSHFSGKMPKDMKITDVSISGLQTPNLYIALFATRKSRVVCIGCVYVFLGFPDNDDRFSKTYTFWLTVFLFSNVLAWLILILFMQWGMDFNTM